MKVNQLKLLLPLLFVGCSVDHAYISEYVYQNNSTLDIEITAYAVLQDANGKVELSDNRSFSISKGKSSKMPLDARGDFRPPFKWVNYGNADSLIVSNGVKQFVEKRESNDKLYRIESYTLESSKDYKRVYVYTFTDDDFVNAD